MKTTSYTLEKKAGKTWATVYTTDSAAAVWERLARDLMAKMNKSPAITRTTSRNMYDGTREVLVTYDNGTRGRYIIPEF